MDNYINVFHEIILYNGDFYLNEPKKVFLHNRMDNITYTFKDINIIPQNELKNVIDYDKFTLLIDGFHKNMGHLMWDAMYTSWYGLFFHDEKMWNENFQWITLHNSFQKNNKTWHCNILEKFSGNKITTPVLLSKGFNKPLKIKLLICGIKNLGIGCVDKNICANTSFKNHITNPVETFINRIYLRYNIVRNNYINNNSNINKIIYVHNKRPYRGIDMLFSELNNKYKNVYNFIYINWAKYTFAEQLNILNTTRIIICGVGTARTNSPFVPNGSVEIQTNDHNNKLPYNISYFDCHIGTLSKYLKVFNINSYTNKECNQKSISKELLPLIENTLKIVPYNNNFNIEDNLPTFINTIKHKLSDKHFNIWRNKYSNCIEDIYEYILLKDNDI